MDEQFMLKEWHETAGKKLDVLDAICRVSDSWAVAVLCSELEALAIEEHEQLKKLGIHNQAEALRKLCRLEQ